MTATLLHGDCLDLLPTLEAGGVRCCVTSPPYWGLRDYGVAGQLGLEATPEQYVEQMTRVFREVRRVLADDGTLWLNLGDTYAANRGYQVPDNKHVDVGNSRGMNAADFGLKPKDLVGIPWRVAFALQQPYYTGSIRDERNRIWLAAMLDTEGCLFIHKRKAGQHNGQGYYRQNDSYGPGVEISNTSRAIVERVAALVGKGSICEQESGRFGRKQTLYRWNLRTTESRDFVRELYPYLVGKRRQARILYGCPSSGERAEAAHAALKILHQGGETDVDFPAPEPMFEPGFYLRSDIIWSKCNPMPESVTDRPTKAHEYLFLLSKSPRYYYNADAIAEDATTTDAARFTDGGKDKQRGHGRRHAGFNGRYAAAVLENGPPTTRNARSVWTIATQPYSGAHFATFPEELARRCILAGSAPGDTVLDPFGGSGTVGQVATGNGRSAVLIELNAEYLKLAEQRIGPMLCAVTP